MPVNHFLPFALGAGANVASQAVWEGETSRATGFQAGTAKSAHGNKLFRQSAAMTHVLAQAIMEATNADVLDNGDLATLKARLVSAVYTMAKTGALGDDLAAYKRIVDGLFASTNGNVGRVDNALTAAVARIAFLEARQNGRNIVDAAYGASGSYVHTFHPDCNWFTFELVGAGGAGGGGRVPAAGQCCVGAGGGSGGYTAGIVYQRKTRIGGSIQVTVGAGGGGSVGGGGTAGGTTSLGTLATAFGGGGGLVVGPTAQGCGNTGSPAAPGSVYSEVGFMGGVHGNGGNPGGTGVILGPGVALGGAGAPGPFGGGGNAAGQNSGGAGATGYGSGGGGACLLPGQGPAVGGFGGPGFARIREFS